MFSGRRRRRRSLQAFWSEGKKKQEKACTIDSVQLMRTFGYKIIAQIANLVLQPHHKVSPLLFLLSTLLELSGTQRGNYKLRRRDRWQAQETLQKTAQNWRKPAQNRLYTPVPRFRNTLSSIHVFMRGSGTMMPISLPFYLVVMIMPTVFCWVRS